MADEPRNRTGTDDPPYRVYGPDRSGPSKPARGPDRPSRAAGRPGDRIGARGGPRADGPDYKLYRSLPRGLRSRLRAEDDLGSGGPGLPRRRGRGAGAGLPWWRRQLRPRRLALWLVGLIVFWIGLSAVLFLISAQDHAGNLPAGAASQLTSGGPMVTSADTVLVLGLDNRPKSGAGSKEPGSNYSEKDANTDTIMLWRVGGGVSRRLSIPRDTLVNIPGLGQAKINAAWAYGGPALALKVIKRFTGLQINHLIVVDLGNFPAFVDDIGGVTVKTPRICSSISGGTANGGFTLDLRPGTHHLTGEQALVLARTRDNSCDPAYDDLNREAMQQEILNGIKSQLFSVHAFLHLPWAAWDAPGVVQTDMGGVSLLQLFVASEIGGSAPTRLLKEANGTYNGASVLIPNQGNVRASVRKLLNG